MIKSEYLVKTPVCKKEDSILSISKTLQKDGARSVIVLEGKNPYGIITLTDIVYKVTAKGSDPAKVKADAVCTKDIFYVTVGDPLEKAYTYMLTNNHLFCPVVGKNGFVGILTISEAVKRTVSKSKK